MAQIIVFPSVRSAERGGRAGNVPSLGEVVEAFLAERDLAASSLRVYRPVFDAFIVDLGEDLPITALTAAMVHGVLTSRWGSVAPHTWNLRRSAIRSLVGFCQQRWPLPEDPLALTAPRRPAVRLDRSIPIVELEELLSRPTVALRERALWWMLYDTAARTSELLALNVEDINLTERAAFVVGPSQRREVVYWTSRSAGLLDLYLDSRRSGPLFLTKTKSRRPTDVYVPTGQGRLSYGTAAAVFREASGGWTLGQIRHSALAHLAEGGTSPQEVQRKGRHLNVRYVAERYYAHVFDPPGE